MIFANMPKKICYEKITRIIRNKIFYALGDSTKFQKFPKLGNFIAFFSSKPFQGEVQKRLKNHFVR